ncbi:uncharacterized protein LOC21389322 isoform X2 [Morus notabilis]|uniref:uncharacterized protein LOC21389322 isoform X2 n=1 Tax=Morus notabilis TaxID=981085 RepID=UPI000CED1FE5|nr:uncharacterized protein LOC21389322 isoform X2 [Morus notabilis]
MWPLYVLFNKAFRAEEDRVSETERLGFFEYFLREQPSGNGTSCGSALCRSRFIEVPHINQLYYWDCGLACVLMVFRTVGINSHNIKSIAELCCTTRNNCLMIFYELIRYLKSHWKLELTYRSISREEISRLILSGKYIAIALVDQHKFRSNSLKESWLKDVFMTDFTGSNSNYTGHYVIICGYDSLTDEFEIRDPASARKHVKVSSDCLEEARKSFGTDEDLLLISLEKSDEQLSPDR